MLECKNKLTAFPHIGRQLVSVECETPIDFYRLRLDIDRAIKQVMTEKDRLTR